MTKTRRQNESVVYSIVRMSQKALMFVLALIGVAYIGGVISIIFDTTLAGPITDFTQIFIPLFQLEIGMYGLGSTLENIQKIKGQIESMNKKNEDNKGKPDNEEKPDNPTNG